MTQTAAQAGGRGGCFLPFNRFKAIIAPGSGYDRLPGVFS